MGELKEKYNHTLKRFEKGCIYLGNHKDEVPKYIPEMVIIVKDLGIIVDMLAEKYNYVMNDDEIQNGFKS